MKCQYIIVRGSQQGASRGREGGCHSPCFSWSQHKGIQCEKLDRKRIPSFKTEETSHDQYQVTVFCLKLSDEEKWALLLKAMRHLDSPKRAAHITSWDKRRKGGGSGSQPLHSVLFLSFSPHAFGLLSSLTFHLLLLLFCIPRLFKSILSVPRFTPRTELHAQPLLMDRLPCSGAGFLS